MAVSPAVSPIPAGYHSVTPYLIVNDAARAIGFYQRAFGATELFRLDGPDGKIGHAEIKIGNSPIMLADEMPDGGYRGPQSIGGTPVSLMIYVEDVDRMFAQAIAAGGRNSARCRTSSTGIAPARSSIRSAMSGRSRRTSRMSRPRRLMSVSRR